MLGKVTAFSATERTSSKWSTYLALAPTVPVLVAVSGASQPASHWEADEGSHQLISITLKECSLLVLPLWY